MSSFDRSAYTLSRPGTGYEIHYGHRSRNGFRVDPNARDKTMHLLAFDGVHGVGYVEAVARALDTAMRYYELRFPAAAGRLPLLHVYLSSLGIGFDGLTLAGDSGPEIWLRNRYEEAAGPLVSARIEAACAHELFHAHQMVCCPDSLGIDRPWSWWGEATATFMETQVHPDNEEFIGFLYPWLDTPSTSANITSRGYGDVLLCELLEERLGAGLVLKTWTMDPLLEDPTDALEIMTRRCKIPFASSSAPDFFGTQFALALYFLDDPRYGFKRLGSLLAGKLGGVYTAGVWELEETLAFAGKNVLYGLSAEYHLITLIGRCCSVEICIDCEGDSYGKPTICPIKGLVVQVDGGGAPIEDPTEIVLSSTDDEAKFRGTTVLDLESCAVELLVVIVNCTTYGDREHACREYSIMIGSVG